MTKEEETPEYVATLEILRNRTIETGQVFEIQEKHLNVWATILFDGVCERYEVKLAMNTSRCAFLGFGKIDILDFPDRFWPQIRGLPDSVRFLFGPHWDTAVSIDGNLLYSSDTDTISQNGK